VFIIDILITIDYQRVLIFHYHSIVLSTQMDITTALKITTVIGGFYAGNCVFMTDKYLEDQAVAKTDGTKYLVSGLVGGVFFMAAMNYYAGWTDSSMEVKDMVMKCNMIAFSWWIQGSVRKIWFNPEKKDKDPIGPYIDLGICTTMLTMLGSTFM